MGTNYYLRKNACPHCGRSDDEYHIGKSGVGWHFSLHVDASENVTNLEELKAKLKTGRIFDEYGEEIAETEMISVITERCGDCEHFDKKPHGYESWPVFHDMNGSEQGMNGLLRHKVDGRHCVGNGEGTWDYITGYFS